MWLLMGVGLVEAGWKANECTVSFFDADSGDLLHVEHVLRKMSLTDKHGTYIGA